MEIPEKHQRLVSWLKEYGKSASLDTIATMMGLPKAPIRAQLVELQELRLIELASKYSGKWRLVDVGASSSSDAAAEEAPEGASDDASACDTADRAEVIADAVRSLGFEPTIGDVDAATGTRAITSADACDCGPGGDSGCDDQAPAGLDPDERRQRTYLAGILSQRDGEGWTANGLAVEFGCRDEAVDHYNRLLSQGCDVRVFTGTMTESEAHERMQVLLIVPVRLVSMDEFEAAFRSIPDPDETQEAPPDLAIFETDLARDLQWHRLGRDLQWHRLGRQMPDISHVIRHWKRYSSDQSTIVTELDRVATNLLERHSDFKIAHMVADLLLRPDEDQRVTLDRGDGAVGVSVCTGASEKLSSQIKRVLEWNDPELPAEVQRSVKLARLSELAPEVPGGAWLSLLQGKTRLRSGEDGVHLSFQTRIW